MSEHSDYDLWHIVEVVLPLPLKGEGSGKLSMSWGGDDVHCVAESQYLHAAKSTLPPKSGVELFIAVAAPVPITVIKTLIASGAV